MKSKVYRFFTQGDTHEYRKAIEKAAKCAMQAQLTTSNKSDV